MNKYAKQSKEAQKQRKLERMCLNKVQFNTLEEAHQKNQRIYLCPNCKKYHRSGQLQQLIVKISK